MRKIISGHGPQREARYQDELVDCPSAARRTPTPRTDVLSAIYMCYVGSEILKQMDYEDITVRSLLGGNYCLEHVTSFLRAEE
jgi:hypothetical protein